MMTICTMIRMLEGICFLIMLIDRFEQAVTLVSARDMINAVTKLLVTARAEQTPNTWKVMGLLSINGSLTTDLDVVLIFNPSIGVGPGTACIPGQTASTATDW